MSTWNLLLTSCCVYTTGKHIQLISGQLVRKTVRSLSANLIRDRLIRSISSNHGHSKEILEYSLGLDSRVVNYNRKTLSGLSYCKFLEISANLMMCLDSQVISHSTLNISMLCPGPWVWALVMIIRPKQLCFFIICVIWMCHWNVNLDRKMKIKIKKIGCCWPNLKKVNTKLKIP